MSELGNAPAPVFAAMDLAVLVKGLSALNDIDLALIVYDLDTDWVDIIGQAEHLPLPGRIQYPALLDLLPPDTREQLQQTIAYVRLHPGAQTLTCPLTGLDGAPYWGKLTLRHDPRPDGHGVILGTLQNVTTMRAAQQALTESEAKLSAVVEHTTDAITIKDREGHYLLVNPSASQGMNGGTNDLLGQTLTSYVSQKEFVTDVQAREEEVMASGESRSFEVAFTHRGQDRTMSVNLFPFWQRGEIKGTISVARDIEALKAMERELREYARTLEERVQERTSHLSALARQSQHAADHDELTGLPNRKQFMEHLQQRIDQRGAGGSSFSVLFCDTDQFKLVNDSLGHVAGDVLLQLIARRIQEHAPPGTLVARYGGDEFLLLTERCEEDDGMQLAAALTRVLEAPFDLNGQEVCLTLSIGVTPCGREYARAEDAVRDADIAMYRAKRQHPGSAALFEPIMLEQQMRLMALQSDLTRALRQDELFLQYQPVLHHSGRVSGVEALVRWQHPRHGLIPPADFIPLAEERRLIRELDLWVLRRACTEVGQLPGPPLYLGVNFSARHFEQPGLTEQIDLILKETGFPARYLIVEITERVLLIDDMLASLTLRELRERGIQVAIDDFGTGYSALSYIQRFPLDIVKVDRAFTAEITRDAAIVRSIAQMASSLKLRVVAEGVETPEQQTILTSLGCEDFQGFLYSRPLDVVQLRMWLDQNVIPQSSDA